MYFLAPLGVLKLLVQEKISVLSLAKVALMWREPKL